METTKLSNETMIEGAKIAEKWFNETNSAIMGIYNKQLNLATGLYNNFINSVSANNKNPFLNTDFSKWFPFPFSNDGNGFTNPFFTSSNPFAASSNPVLESFSKTYKQMLEYNNNVFKALAEDTNWSEISEEYSKILESRLEASRNIMNSISETFNKQLDFSIEADKKLIEDINKQFNTLMKQNQKLWVETSEVLSSPLNKVSKKSSEPNITESKKKSGFSAVA